MTLEKIKNRIIPFLVFSAIAAGIVLRINHFRVKSLEYDEVWTVRHYLHNSFFSVFTDLSTPNNHPLNTIFIQLCARLSENIHDIRIPALCLGIATLLAGICFAWKLTGKYTAVLMTATVLSFHAYLVCFSQTARGHALQTFFVLISAAAFFQLMRGKHLIRNGILFLFAAICSCLTISSGLLFICALCGAGFAVMLPGFLSGKRKKQRILSCLFPGLFFLFAILWYGWNYKEIAAGQRFGISVGNPLSFLNFLIKSITDLNLLLFLVILIAGTVFLKTAYRKIAWSAILFTAFVFLSALITKAGPIRVYQPVVPIIVLAASGILEQLCRKKKQKSYLPAIIISILCIAVFPEKYSKITPPDWHSLESEIIKSIPSNIFVNFTPNDSYAIVNNHTKAKEDFVKRLSTIPVKGFLQVNSPGSADVYNAKTGEPVSLRLSEYVQKQFLSEKGILLDLYELVPLTEAADVKGKPLFLTIIPMKQKEYDICFGILNSKGGNWYLCNLFLNHKFYAPDGKEVKTAAFLTPEAVMDANLYLKLTHFSKGTFRFYTFREQHSVQK